ncbi:hypothetical protein [Natrinema halophilum]|uniref:hypothetical protein n=1 Tax=Natrinema halophilum TaxID=1699371 RepID=UPI001F40A270|nr:hypothetical protein [Natrinema halophilum]UHQ96418.1 hypothetical protein HYG82_23545 [Natrinema halophilum]
MPAEDLKYLTNGELREEIAYTVGGDPTRYGVDSERGLTKADVFRIAVAIEPDDTTVDLPDLDLEELYRVVCKWAGGEYNANVGNAWRINRPNLKRIHQAVDAQPPREVVSP